MAAWLAATGGVTRPGLISSAGSSVPSTTLMTPTGELMGSSGHGCVPNRPRCKTAMASAGHSSVSRGTLMPVQPNGSYQRASAISATLWIRSRLGSRHCLN
jgi:hypothetical protein